MSAAMRARSSRTSLLRSRADISASTRVARLRWGRSSFARPPRKILAAPLHQRGELCSIVRVHGAPDSVYSFAQRLQGFAAVLVQTLDFEVKIRALVRNARSDVDLRIVCRTGERCEARRRFA